MIKFVNEAKKREYLNQINQFKEQIKKKNNDIRELSPTLRNKSVSNGALIDNTAEIIEKLKKDRDDYLESLKKFKTEFRKEHTLKRKDPNIILSERLEKIVKKNGY